MRGDSGEMIDISGTSTAEWHIIKGALTGTDRLACCKTVLSVQRDMAKEEGG